MTILLANTVGSPKRMIQEFLAAGAASSRLAFEKIWEFLHKEYGNPIRVWQTIQKKLDDMPNIYPPRLEAKLKELFHICHMIEANMPTYTELQIFNLNAVQKKVWSKLPD